MTVSQSSFFSGLFNSEIQISNELIDGQKRPAGHRYNIYRNNIIVSLIDALKDSFPIISKLLGAENMIGLAKLYILAHPPSSPLLMHFGNNFPKFLSEHKELSHLGYLPDIARLEIKIHQSYHAADAEPVDIGQFEQMTPDRIAASSIKLAPALALVRSSWPIFSIWRFNSEKNAPKPKPVAEDVLIMRPEFDPKPYLLPLGGADFISALQTGKSVNEAYNVAAKTIDHFDLTPVFNLLLQGNVIISLN
ncbi:MAG: DNA-binding domain-containing protein [Aestuariivita sp.]|nr:DNA-binding domain-containing protein [Aestuariivita sp.]